MHSSCSCVVGLHVELGNLSQKKVEAPLDRPVALVNILSYCTVYKNKYHNFWCHDILRLRCLCNLTSSLSDGSGVYTAERTVTGKEKVRTHCTSFL